MREFFVNGRWVVCLLLIAMLACVIAALATSFAPMLPASKFLDTASGCAALASIAQLRISGWFERVLEIYGDDTKYPNGPPSHITRQIIENPDRPLQSWLRGALFFNVRFGADLAVLSVILSLAGTWTG